MKRIFTLLLILTVFMGYAQRGDISLDSKSDVGTVTLQSKDRADILLPGNWADATEVGTYRWVDENSNPLGWIFGNNTYGDLAVGQRFNVSEPYYILGAHFWVSELADDPGDVVFSVHTLDGVYPGDVIASVTIPANDINNYPTGDGILPDQYPQTPYIEFDSPVYVEGDYVLVVDFSDLSWAAHEDGLGMATNIIGSGGGGLDLALIKGTDGWVKATEVNAALDLDVGIFPLVTDEVAQSTVVDIIVNSEDHTILATAVTAAGLVDALSGEGPFTVFAPTNAAFDALPEGLLDDLLADPEGDLTTVLLYHVVAANVLSGDLTDGQVITTLLGQDLTVSIDGEDVFIIDSEGNQAQVTVPDLEADNGVVHVVDGVLIPDLTVQMFSVTFNVDMTEVEGFDPDVHDVYIAGSFPGDLEWNEPGSNDDLKLTLVGPTKEDPVTIWEEGFEPAVDTGVLPDGWTQKKADNAIGDNLQDLAEGDTQWWRYSEQYDMGYGDFYPEWIRTGEASMHINWNVEAEQNVYAISPVFVLPEADMMMLEFWKYFPASYETEINVLLELDGTWEVIGEYNSAEVENLYSSAVEIDLTGKVGTARIAFAYKWTDGIQMNIDDIKVYGTPSGPAEDYIYTITLDAEEGELLYKYFSTVIAEGWAGGEWEGDPNRSIEVDADLTVNDIWGDKPSSVVENELAEQGINLFPNPVSNTLFVENSELINELRIYDLTGRLVFSQVVNDNNTSVNVSMFKTGVYIMQVMTDNSVASKKFNVK